MSTRRTFVQQVGVALGGAPLFDYLQPYVSRTSLVPMLEIYATNWGFKGSIDEFCAQAKAAGYIGIEVWTPAMGAKTDKLMSAVKEHDLKLALLAGNRGSTYDEHLQTFTASIDHALTLAPTFINCHAGKDFFIPMQNDNFLEYSVNKSKESGIPIYHETHRGRMLYSATVAEQYLEQYEDVSITLDISHWCCVHESLLEDQKERIEKMLARTGHIHARVGFAEAPQIPDPQDPQFESAVVAHFAWWDTVVDRKTKAEEVITMTTEFGPPPYMWTHLGSRKPLADNWQINVAMKDMWEKRYLK